MKQRSAFWDNYKGLLICLVVFGHFIYTYATTVSGGTIGQIFTWIYLFHMPAFIFCSGIFSRSRRSRSGLSLTRLMLYYIIFNTLMMLYYVATRNELPRLLTPYASFWYLLSLICWRLCADRLSKIKGIVPISFAAALLAGFWGEFSNLLSLARTVAFFPFFLLGYKFDPDAFRAKAESRSTLKKILHAAAALIVLAVLFVFAGKVSLSVDLLCFQPYASGSHAIWRFVVMVAAAAGTASLLLIVPHKNIPVLTTLGRNCLLIYLGHRFLVLIFDALVPCSTDARVFLIFALLGSLVTLLLLGSSFVNKLITTLFDRAADKIYHEKPAGRRFVCVMLLLALIIGAYPLPNMVIQRFQKQAPPVDVQAVIDDSVVITFVGDLVLLKEQVTSAWDDNAQDYDFSHMFRYVAPYFAASDLTIGVLEGPLAGEDAGYSTSDYDDGYAFYLNFPDAFAEDIAASGVDLVTTANNHLLDRGVDGAMRTLDVLDDAGLLHTGSYRDETERDTLLTVDVQGLKLAVLSYTQMVNGHTLSDMTEQYPYMTAMLAAPSDPNYDRQLSQVQADFDRAKQSGADLIVVLPHMGTQFSHRTDSFQNHWNKVFAELGADLILGNHAHAVQPLEYIDDTLVVNCPGNLADGYTGHDSDAKAIVEVYLDSTTGRIKGSAVIPMYTQEMEKGYYRALPVYDALHLTELRDNLPSRDLDRMQEVHELVTEVMVGEKISTANIQPRYYFADGRYCPYEAPTVPWQEYSDSTLLALLEDASHVVVIGDEITKGDKSLPWYAPLADRFSETTFTALCADGAGMDDGAALCAAADLTDTDVIIIALGMNDLRFGSVSTQTYIQQLDELAAVIARNAPNAELCVIAPWSTRPNDQAAVVSPEDRSTTLEQLCIALEAYAEAHGVVFLDPNPYLEQHFALHHQKLYTKDGIHPNAVRGVGLYTTALLDAAVCQ